MTNQIETTECIGSKCADWYKCKEVKEAQEAYFKKQKKEPPEWVCKWPYPGANPDQDDMLTIHNWEIKKIKKNLDGRDSAKIHGARALEVCVS